MYRQGARLLYKVSTMKDDQETFEAYRRKFDVSAERTMRAAMAKLDSMRDPGVKHTRYRIITSNKRALRVFSHITKRWWEFWK